jgi:hypothetical protein
VIGDAVAIAARLQHAGVPTLELLAGDAEKLRTELGRLLQHAHDLIAEFESLERTEPNYVDAQAWFLRARLYDVRRMITLAHCELIPRSNPERRRAAMNTAEFFRQKMPIEHRVPSVERAA